MKKTPILSYSDTGSGPTVVLLHGFISNSTYWRNVLPQLTGKHRVINIDLLGFGKSPKPVRSRYDYDAQLLSIAATLKKAEVTKPFTLVGHSMGSLLALRYAKTHKTDVKKLILSNMPILLTSDQARAEILGTNRLYRLGLRNGINGIVWPLFRAVTLLQLLSRKARHNAVVRNRLAFSNTMTSRLRSLRNVVFTPQIEIDLQAISVQTVLVSGIDDRAIYLENLATLSLGKHVSIKNIVGGHHLPMSTPSAITMHI
ncbi:alpha/beta fold hydrolase [Candidatus Saccharibacteria bacterium]|nr:alpha/beta fold hydrolase [Candidatus Saccharibacteria bacterium]